MDDIDSAIEREGGLRRSLTVGQLSMLAIGGAIGTGLFLGSAFAIGIAGPAVIISYAIGAVIALLLMGCLAEMTVAHPSSGSFGLIAGMYVSPLAGFLVRYAYLAGNILAVGTEVTAIAIYMKYWFPATPGWWWIIGFSGALVAINAFSVKTFGAVEYLFSLIKLAAIAIFILLGSFIVFGAEPGSAIGFANYTAHGGFLPNGLWGMWVAVIIAIFSYFSIEMIAVAAGEAKDPKRAIVRAFRMTLFRLTFFYLATLALMLAIVPWNQAGASGSPFVTVMAATGITGAAGIINFVILIAALSAMNSQIYASTRMIFSLSRSGFAPAALGRVSDHGVPTMALGISTIGIAIAGAIYAARPETAFMLMISLASFGAMFAWGMIFVTHLFFRAKRGSAEGKFLMWGYPYTSLAGALLMAAILFTTFFTEEFRMTLICGLPFLAALTALYYLRYRNVEVPVPEAEGGSAP
ncbi:MAG: amino acid permease [Sphingosinicella sp.]|nr:amino acid permease [Sphingosinicella sp.]